jgi:arabinan endo-1,5-alpha-L-arabinosidase
MMDSRRGGTLVLSANGNKWVGPGHHSIATDLSGQQWFAYHAIDKNNPYLEPPWGGINRRPMLVDRLDWIGGWPTLRAGAWASEDSQVAPVTSFSVGDDFNGDATLSSEWFREGAAQDGWQLASEQDARTYVRQTTPSKNRSYLLNSKQGPTNFRAEADLRLPAGSTGAAGLVAAYRNPANHIEAWLDAGANALVTDVIVKGRHSTQKTTLPSVFRFDTWHNVAIEVRGTSMTVEVTDARLGDPLASQQRTLPSGAGGQGAVGVVSRSARSEADNMGATLLYTPVTQTVPDPVVGALDTNYSDEFDNEGLDPAWSWVRTPAGQESSGVFTWPTQNADLYGNINNASVLLRDEPQGEYTVETKLSIDLGINTDRSFQQAGLVAYADDDNYTKLVHAAIGTGRRTEFAKEEAGAYGEMMVGPPADSTWLRISHRVDPNNGEHEYRAATSRDGEHWVWGGVWTFPAGTNTRIGLVSMGGSGATAQFDYFRVFRP